VDGRGFRGSLICYVVALRERERERERAIHRNIEGFILCVHFSLGVLFFACNGFV
jgi:hypothetical protein